MKGTILDFLKLVSEKPELAKELFELAGKYDFEFSDDELTEDDLDSVAGGAEVTAQSSAEQPDSREYASSEFENANQKATQYVNMLASVLKTMNEMHSGVIRNLR
jgi:hypothetical protein